MGPSKPAESDATFAFSTQLHGNEAKAFQTQVLLDFCSGVELFSSVIFAKRCL